MTSISESTEMTSTNTDSGAAGDIAQQMSAFVRKLKATPRRTDSAEIRIPSERAFRERERRRVEGIVLERKVVAALQAL